VKDVAAVLADLGSQSGSLAAARALLVAAWHPEEAPGEEDDYHHKHDDDGDSHPNLASVRFIPAMERTIAARIDAWHGVPASRGVTRFLTNPGLAPPEPRLP
jgi:hypothetical protein